MMWLSEERTSGRKGKQRRTVLQSYKASGLIVSFKILRT